MQLSVVILNYNVKFFLDQCIRSVQKALRNIQAEIIVVDNGSVDGSRELVAKEFPELKYIYCVDNSGFSVGNNRGVKQAKGKYLCILNPDTIVAESTFEKLLDFVEVTENCGIVGCKMIDGTGAFCTIIIGFASH